MSGLPDFLIIGAPRCGTTSLFFTLANHPNIQRPIGTGLENKEPGYFSRPTRVNRGIDWYKSIFPDRKPGCLLFEATTSYIWCAEKIQPTLPNVKAIALLRNPTVRAWGYFWYKYHKGTRYRHPIESIVGTDPIHVAVRRGIYVDMIRRWHSLFPPENLLVIKSEDWFRRPRLTIAEICTFLGIPELPLDIIRGDPWMELKAKHGYPPRIPPNIKRWLTDFYHPYNQQLEEYLGRSFGWGKE